ncbi:MAG: energy transducer TonB [Spartobacteria bacterium]
MENTSARRAANLFLILALLCGAFTACKKKTETVAASPTPTRALPAVPLDTTIAPPITGSVTPALVNQERDSITHYLHFPKDPKAAKMDGAVQFYCDVTATGSVETIHALIANDDAFKSAVQTALDWGHFTPATVEGKPVTVYLGGSVVFLHQNGEEVIVVSLATHDRDRVGKLGNYIQPQMIGGLRQTIETAIRSLKNGILVAGKAEVVVSVDPKGAITGTSGISENPKGSGLGELINSAVRKAQFTPAYENGTPAAGGVNVVGSFGR